VKIPVKHYSMDESASWQERHRQLEAHHQEETTWLIAEVKRLEAECTTAAEHKHQFDYYDPMSRQVACCCGARISDVALTAAVPELRTSISVSFQQAVDARTHELREKVAHLTAVNEHLKVEYERARDSLRQRLRR